MKDSSMSSRASPQGPKSSALLENLGLLVGEWDLELVFPSDLSRRVHGKATFDWLEGDAFVIERLADSRWIMGPDDSSEEYSVLYHDGRGVSRVYQMSLDSSAWKMWRISPGFSQRFEGRFSDDKSMITAHWEKSNDGSTWEHDFDLTYTKVG
jgi:hypothetical protein